ncbi:hypothetical protein MMC13_000167 [Lambiella insularis]|nr:hypothetical protein [Lambiella insularis]
MATASDGQHQSNAGTGYFQYHQELEEDEIRLIGLETGSRQDSIAAKLLHKKVDDDTIKYDALSYVWGSKSDAVTITCDDRPLYITQNLHKALVELREDGMDNSRWVDAVCIDQLNLGERARQIRLMRHIYSQAQMVYIWIGEELATTKIGAELLCRISKAVQALPSGATTETNILNSKR